MRPPDSSRRFVVPLACLLLSWPLLEASGAPLSASLPGLQVVALRYTFHLIWLVPVVALARGWGAFRTRRPVLQLLRGSTMFLMPSLFLAAVRYESPGTAVWGVFWVAPLLVLLGTVVLGDPVEGAILLGVAATAAGAWAIHGAVVPGVEGLLLGLGSAAAFASYLLLSRRLKGESIPASLLYTAVGALLPTLLVAAPRWVPVGRTHLAVGALLGLLSLVVLGALDLVIERADLGDFVPWLAVVPLIDLVTLSLLTGRRPGPLAILGAVLILGALTFMALRVRGARRRARAGTV